ncbi:hypothetical protein ACMZOO_09165 [Catenovulum sp. SX2]|uniref:hypothetical protein n=1 Tax=Catenovulum sp. SX2 TaxID=3398614 RepID=UPI003F865585
MPTIAVPPLKQRHIRILWASWHIVSLFGFAIAALLVLLASPSSEIYQNTQIKLIIAIVMALSGLLVIFATNGKHPGWIGLILVSILICLT